MEPVRSRPVYIPFMSRIFLALLALGLATPVLAQDQPGRCLVRILPRSETAEIARLEAEG